ncbi:unnamed protein product [Enterobius vermicularis]|uniref:UPF0729 protein n=1 Tax=Enterobius vermicularis TaxID=51028 RepID=A0A0N4VG81_ENTVE|nr:unnamed protein product [Enterobius vermicularis]
MVCVPCLILPVILAIYLKFIQPYVLRLFPESWRAKFDAILYPTCPIQTQAAKANVSKVESSEETPACSSGNKKTD